MRAIAVLAALAMCAVATPVRAQQTAPAPPPRPTVRQVHVAGTRELSDRVVLTAAHVHVDEPLPDAPDAIAKDIERRYRSDGYTFARAVVSFDEGSGTLDVTVDEGVIDGVEFQGVSEPLARGLEEDFALRAGDVFNRDRADEALRALLRPMRGAVTAGHVAPGTFTDSRELRHGPFDLVERNGRRILLVGLREPQGRFHLASDLGEREDWYTPVDGFVPSVGFGAAVYDHEHFNHAYVAGHLSAKLASGRIGYALGFERPFFTKARLFVGGELRDLTGTDDAWRLSSAEASVAAIGPHKSYRDYFRRRGVQITAAWRVRRQLELLFAWRDEHQSPLADEAEFSVWNGGDSFRPNIRAADGRLSALLIGATLSSEDFERESLQATYRRHQLDSFYGAPLTEWADGGQPLWRVDWTSEISTPGVLQSDFDFRRHIVAERLTMPLSPHQAFAARAIGGWSGGVLPPQNQFAIGGLGSVHGYPFKQEIGDSLALVNLEYLLGWKDGLHVVGFFDAGRVAPTGGDAPWLKGVGFGIGLDGVRVDFGYRLSAVPSSLQVLVRFGRTF
ncbi:MAG: POTRA domain-containing protein [Betaproteobacteria bacterium]